MPKTNIRLRILLIIILLLSLATSIRIIYLSLKESEEYNILEEGEFTFKRGDILDRNGKLLATSDELDSLYANPREIKSIEKNSKVISRILNTSVESIRQKLKSKNNFVWLKRQITPKQAEIIRSKKIPGIGLKKEYKRFYPNRKLASHILGFCNVDSRGVEGIEKSMDSYLISDMTTQSLEGEKIRGSKGLNVVLTIDANIQAFSDKVISDYTKKFRADIGSIILLDGRSGEILSMSNYPDFDPNLYNEYDQKSFRNYAIFSQYEPGSVLKIFSVASLLDSNKITKSSFFHCNGSYIENDITVKCTGIHGSINYYGILKYSCNSGMLQAAKKIKDIDLYHYLKLFGFGLRTTIKLPGEQSGILRDIDNWSFRSMLSIPLGHEISVNALQIVRAATTFVNDGIMMEPFVVKKIVDVDNKIIKIFNPKEIRRVLKKEISNSVLKAMKSSTEVGGTVQTLYIEDIQFGAKSGTAQIFDTKLNKYLDNNLTSSLLTIFPLNNPRYILYVVFHRPKSKIKWGGVIGAETLNKFLSSMTGYLELDSKKDYEIKESNIKINREFVKIKTLPVKMPNVRGLTAGDVMGIFSEVNVKFKINGIGYVNRYTPAEGQIINNGDTITLELTH